MKGRSIARITGGSIQYDGAGVRLVRVIGYDDVHDFDPFLLLDAFDSTDPDDYIKGFPWHPHRGIETVTYLIEGTIEHGDSLGNTGTIDDGCCQWMTAGSGIIHQEMPQPRPQVLGCQLWLNLPKARKMTDPAYRDIRQKDIPTIADGGNTVHILSGSYAGSLGAVRGGEVPTTYLDVELTENARWTMPSASDATVFCYIVRGSISTGPEHTTVPMHRAVLFAKDGEGLEVTAGPEGARFFYLEAKALDEPIAWGGPIVMNSREELVQASRELENGTFIKH